jgi:hypothetical protein
MDNKQTAVEWLMDKLKFINKEAYAELYNESFEQAKQMEKEQIIDAYTYGFWRGNNDDELEPEDYYNNPYCNPDNKFYGK